MSGPDSMRHSGSASRLGRGPMVVSFDLDGTLLPTTTVSQFLADRLGHSGLLRELEERFAQGAIGNAVIAELSAPAYAGMRKLEVFSLLEQAPWIAGIEPVAQRLRELGAHLLVGTITWRFAAEFLAQRFGFDAVSGTEMQQIDGCFTGRVRRYFDEHSKVEFVRGYCAGHGVSLGRCVAVGDSRSDIPLFAQVGLAVAINATPAARAAAHVAIDTQDLRALLPVLDCNSPP